MQCNKCKKEIESDSVYCRFCGTKTSAPVKKRSTKKRGNGQGCAYKRGSTWTAKVILGYTVDEHGKQRAISRSKSGFATKREAYDYIPTLRCEVVVLSNPTLDELYNEWLPLHERKVGKSTINCYKSAYKYLAPLYFLKFSQLRTEHWQKIIDACQKGTRTKQNMKALGTLLYKYALQNDIVTKDYATYVYLDNEQPAERVAFTAEQLTTLFKAAHGTTDESIGARYILCLCYTGFRLQEFLELKRESYNDEQRYFIGGKKTEAGRNRIVTVSPKIQPFVDDFMKDGYIFSPDGKRLSQRKFRELLFYPTLISLGIIPANESKHSITPHCCRHTFATLMKNIEAPAIDKQRLIGHSSESMLKYYTHSNIIDLQNITNAI